MTRDEKTEYIEKKIATKKYSYKQGCKYCGGPINMVGTIQGHGLGEYKCVNNCDGYKKSDEYIGTFEWKSIKYQNGYNPVMIGDIYKRIDDNCNWIEKEDGSKERDIEAQERLVISIYNCFLPYQNKSIDFLGDNEIDFIYGLISDET